MYFEVMRPREMYKVDGIERPKKWPSIVTTITRRLIWFKRNEVAHGKNFKYPNLLINRAKANLQAFQDNSLMHQTNITRSA